MNAHIRLRLIALLAPHFPLLMSRPNRLTARSVNRLRKKKLGRKPTRTLRHLVRAVGAHFAPVDLKKKKKKKKKSGLSLGL